MVDGFNNEQDNMIMYAAYVASHMLHYLNLYKFGIKLEVSEARILY